MARNSRPDPLPRITAEIPSLPARAPGTHKGQVGRVAILAGSRGMSGAACLAAMGALRGGAGLVRVVSPASVQPIVAAHEPSAMTVPVPEDEQGCLAERGLDEVLEALAWGTIAAVGPGLGQTDAVRRIVSAVLKELPHALILDADGLNNMAAIPQWWTLRQGRPTIITPHPGEMARLRKGAGLPDKPIGDDDDSRLSVAAEFARLAGVTVVLKGHRTVVCTSDEAYFNTTGNPGMATGGMGDVLTGFLAALLGQHLSPFDAARLGVYCHGLAADRAARQVAPIGYLAREVADALPAALAQGSRPPIGFK
jgi:ADP-dependent NAD(P)H-hydrate dehydratase